MGEPPQEVLDVLFAMSGGEEKREKKDQDLDDLLKSFETLVFGTRDRPNKGQEGNGGTDHHEEEHCPDDESSDETIQEDIEGYLQFIRDLGLGAETDTFLDPDLLKRAATGEISEEELVQLVLRKVDSDPSKDDPHNGTCQQQ